MRPVDGATETTDTQSPAESDTEKNEQSCADTPSENGTRRREGTMGANNHPPHPETSEKFTRRTLLHHGATIAGVFTLGTAIASHPASAQRGIDGCTVITAPGTYVLTQDIEHDGSGQACIQIRSGNVTLDGQGHTITTSQEDEDRGIYVVGSSAIDHIQDVTIQNVEITGFEDGIVVQQTDASSIHDTKITQNAEHGITANGDRIRVGPGNTVTGNTIGIATRGVRNEVVGNTVSGNGDRGIYVRDQSDRAVVTSNVVTDHTGTDFPNSVADPGIVVDELTGIDSQHTVWGNTLRRNGIGILLIKTTANSVHSNTIEASENTAIRLQGGAVENTIRENDIASGIGGGGIFLTESDANLIEENTLVSGAGGIVIAESEENMVRGNEFSAGQISVTDSKSNTLFGNDIRNVRINRSTGTLVLGNQIIARVGNVVGVSRSQDTLVQGNVISGAHAVGSVLGVGVRVTDSDRTDIWSNGIRDNDIGILIAVNGAETTTIAANNFVGNSEYGIKNELEAVVDGRFNFWGARNGPSSPLDPDAPFEDPVTGRLADGDGDAVSKSPKPAPVGEGVSNVRFDPWSRVQQAVVVLPRFNPPTPIEPPSPIEPPFLPPL